MNIPLMIRQIAQGELDAAIRTVKEEIALPAILGRVCPAPCERGCRRSQMDKPVAICLLKRIVGDVDLAQPQPYRAATAALSGRTVAIIGGGPAGLSAAYYLAREGHACTVFERAVGMGGGLRTAIAEDRLPRSVIDAEVAQIGALGVVFKSESVVGEGVPVAALLTGFDAVVVAAGQGGWAALAAQMDLKTDARGIAVKRGTFETSRGGVFACGAAAGGAAQLAVRSCADGKTVAIAVGQYLAGVGVTGRAALFNSAMGRLKDDEKGGIAGCGDARPRVEPALGVAGGLTLAEAQAEAGRCLHCDCRKPLLCKLRSCAGALGAVQGHYRPAERRSFVQDVAHAEVIFERGKCILCGLCVEVAREKGEPIGLGFARRGNGTEIEVPFGEALDRALTVSARECVAVCPTGALTFRK
jgi:NADPH-dependent glutamate synthase beta subunit-like oxidoreductase/NAD-dependent dihydropyrimidine dehydrogenase PreA subunit